MRARRRRPRRKIRYRKARRLFIVSTLFVAFLTLRRPSEESEPEHSFPRPHARRLLNKWDGHSHKVFNAISYTCIFVAHFPVVRSLIYSLLTCPEVFLERSWRTIFSVPYICVSHSCLSAYGRSHFIYADFVVQTFERVMALNIRPKMLTEDAKVAVLLEPRKLPLLEYTIKQVLSTLGDDWGLQVFASRENFQHLTRRLEIYPGGCGQFIKLVDMAVFGFSPSDFRDNKLQSALSLHSRLYEEIVGEHILWFQVDVIMRKSIAPYLLSWSYVGSEWRDCTLASCMACRKVCGGGSSGLSLRRKSAFLRIATNGSLPHNVWGRDNQRIDVIKERNGQYFRSDALYNHTGEKWFEDDLVISAKLQSLGKLPSSSAQREFAVGEVVPSSELSPDPIGLHKPWLSVGIDPSTVMGLLAKPYYEAMKHERPD